jgi:hypothetical protein
MKNIYLLIGTLLMGSQSLADVCALNSKDVSELAAKLIKGQNFVYANQTPGDAAVAFEEVTVKSNVRVQAVKVGSKTFYEVVQGSGRSAKGFDLAYTYILAGPPVARKLVNLGHISGCFKTFEWSTNPNIEIQDAEAYPAAVDWKPEAISCNGACG